MIGSKVTRRGFLGGGMAMGASVAAATASAQAFELDEVTISELQQGMASGRLKARSITELYLGRIDAVDRQGPALRSIIETNPDALSLADALDEERRENGPRGPLHGVPVLLKDNIATADRMTTTAGSYALEGSIPSRGAGVVERLRQTGAILLAKTNLSEWANFRSTRSSSGWSGRGSQCKNPYVLDRNPCGSSAGSGAATSANLGAIALGTETDGSVVCPSKACGLVGIKPTIGLVSRAGIIPVAHSQDTAGPMTRTVTDGAIMLGAIAGVDAREDATRASDGHAHADYTPFLEPDGLRGARIGVARQYFGFHTEVDAAMDEALAAMRAAGAELVDPVELPPDSEFAASEMTVLLYEFKADLNQYLAALGDDAPVKSLAEIIAFNDRHRACEMPYFCQEIFHQAQEKGPLTDKAYRDAPALNHRLTRDEGIDQVCTAHQLDAIVAPTGGPAWATDLVNGDHYSGGSSSAATVAGYANVTVPAGGVHGLPVGISFFGVAWSEPTLLRLAFAFEHKTKAR